MAAGPGQDQQILLPSLLSSNPSFLFRAPGATSKMEVKPDLFELWAKFTEKSEERFFRQFVRGLLSQWEGQCASSWEALVTGWLSGRRVRAPALAELPEELLPALSKFLNIGE